MNWKYWEYEKNNFPIEAPKPVEAIKFRMDQLGMEQKDLARLLGSKSRAKFSLVNDHFLLDK